MASKSISLLTFVLNWSVCFIQGKLLCNIAHFLIENQSKGLDSSLSFHPRDLKDAAKDERQQQQSQDEEEMEKSSWVLPVPEAVTPCQVKINFSFSKSRTSIALLINK